MTKGLTSIVIAIYNTAYQQLHYTGNCIGTIRQHTKEPYEIIIVDNGSTFKDIGKPMTYKADQFIRNKKNMGVAIAWNQGIKKAKGEYICIMNNDIQVYDHWLKDMKDSLNEVDVVTANPMYDDCHGRYVESMERRKKWLKKTPDQYLSDFEDFSCVLTTKKVFDEVGLFDEEFILGYGEDTDWKFRIKEKGMVIKTDKRVNIHHIISATASTLTAEDAKKDFGLDWEKYKIKDPGKDKRYGEMKAGVSLAMDLNKKRIEKKWKVDKYGVPEFKRKKAGKQGDYRNA